MIEATIHIEKEASTETRALLIPETMEEITARGFVDLLLTIEQWPQWVTKWASMSPQDQEDDMALWNEEEFAEYFLAMLAVVAATSGVNIEDLKHLPIVRSSKISGVIPLATNIINVALSYEATERERFTHKGINYVLPTSELIKIGSFEERVFMPRESVGSVIEALQRQHIFSAKNDDGEFHVKDRLYYSDLAVVACLARREKEDGTLESPPLGLQEFSDFVNSRMQEFADIPADIFRDVGFFLLSLSKRQFSILTSDLFSKIPSTHQARKKPRLPWKQNKN